MSAGDATVGSQSFKRNQIQVTDTKSLKRTIWGTSFGNFAEWFDFGVYSFLITTLKDVFFPGSEWADLAVFGGLAVSFLVRPVGGIFWGLLADRIGGKRVLVMTVVLMAVGTCAIGLLPSYAALGMAAPILLFAFRCVQGFSTGGEYVGAMTFLCEHSPDKRRGHMCSFLPVGTLAGYILGALIVVLLEWLLSDAAMSSWGWRIPFWLAAPFGLIGLYIRLKLHDSPADEEDLQSDDASHRGENGLVQLKRTITRHWRSLLVCMGIVVGVNVTNYMLTGYMPAFLLDKLGMPEEKGLMMVSIVLAILLVIVVPLGMLSDRIGRKTILWIGSGMLVVLAFPMFLLIESGGQGLTFLGLLLMGLTLICFLSTEPSTLPTLFPTKDRYGSVAIGLNIAVTAFGGTTPLIASALLEATDWMLVPACLLVVAGIVAAVAVCFTPEPRGKHLPGSGPVVESEEEAAALATGGAASAEPT